MEVSSTQKKVGGAVIVATVAALTAVGIIGDKEKHKECFTVIYSEVSRDVFAKFAENGLGQLCDSMNFEYVPKNDNALIFNAENKECGENISKYFDSNFNLKPVQKGVMAASVCGKLDPEG